IRSGGAPTVTARMRAAPALSDSASSDPPSESDIVGPNLQEAGVTRHVDALGTTPVHRPEIQIGCVSPKFAVSPAPIAGDLDTVSEDQVPGRRTVGGHETENA